MKFQKKEKKRFNKVFWMSAIIITIMVLSTLGFIYGSSSGGGSSYNGFKFKQTNNRWAAKVGGNWHLFYYHPEELSYINGTGIRSAIVNATAIYITFDPVQVDMSYVELGRYELANELSSTKSVYNGIANESTSYALPVIGCENATSAELVIYFKQSRDLNLNKEGNCIIAEGNGADFIRLRDRILYSYYGIMD